MNQWTLKQFAENVIVVLVLYKLELKNSPSYDTLSKCLRALNLKLDLVVYDNSPQIKENDINIVSENWNIQYLHDSTNPGVSKAYNQGYLLGKKLSKKWLLLVDQDTQFPENALPLYLNGVLNYPQVHLFAPILKCANFIVSPARYMLKRGFVLKQVRPGLNSLTFMTPVNSGLLINMKAFEQAGGYKEEIKLDFSDFYFVNQFRKWHKNFVVLDMVCQHGISTLDNSDIGSALNRFKYYCEGAFFASENLFDKNIYYLITFLRALTLTKKFKKIIFIKNHFKFWSSRW